MTGQTRRCYVLACSKDEGETKFEAKVNIHSDGSCLWLPARTFTSTCSIDVTWFPFDEQVCKFKFGSWMYDGFQVDLQLYDDSATVDLSNYVFNGEWRVLGKCFFVQPNSTHYEQRNSEKQVILAKNYV